MLPPLALLRARLRAILDAKDEQGYAVDAVRADLDSLADSYDGFDAFARRLEALPLRTDWPHVEPVSFDEIRLECEWPTEPIGSIDLDDAAARIETAFLSRVAGCVLGKPFEFDPTMDVLRAALDPVGEWPLRDYPTLRAIDALPHRIYQWFECAREQITHVAPDDDINYSLLAMMMLEQHGASFTHEHMRDAWIMHLPLIAVFGPERTMLTRAAVSRLEPGVPDEDPDTWVHMWNPADEYCGAAIRADAYGYAAIGRPALAAELAWRDASFTHRRTGVYATMFLAAAIAAAPYSDRLGMFEVALRYVPRTSRFSQTVQDCLRIVRSASSFEDGYERIREAYAPWTHCRIFQEVGTLINTMRWARAAGDGICLQVMQGNDTDSFGATAGSLLGMHFGPGSLDERWIAPFNDDLHSALALFYERSLRAVAARMGALPRLMRA